MKNKNEEIHRLLVEHGLWEDQAPQETEFTNALSRLLPDEEMSLQIAFALERTLQAHGRSRILLAKLCAHLQRLTGKGTSDVAVCLFVAAPELTRSLSEVSKLLKAGDVLISWPLLSDIENIDKLATLRRVPKALKAETFGSGMFPDGTEFRTLTTRELRAAVNALRSGNQAPQPEPPVRKAKRDLIRLANYINELSEQLSMVPDFSAAKARLDDWYVDLLALVRGNPENVRQPIVIRSIERNLARSEQVGRES